MIHLLWAVHNHQPVGNFDFIFERAFDRAYSPFLEVLKRHPNVRVSIHFTGILLDWLEQHRPEYLRDVRALCDAGRVEILGGGYYEPILPMLTEADRRGQVTALSDRLEKVFGHRPRGMWLAERVWEPSLVSAIADSGIEYVILDGSHFKMVGKTEEDLDGYFETEDQGRRLKLLPIHDGIRDTIPFKSVEDVVGALRALNDAKGFQDGVERRVQVVFGDDGEKFGDWPDTYETVYTHGWLDRFFSALEAEPATFAVRPLREGVDLGKSLGLVYLPPASYGEMMVWAQNPENIPRFRAMRQMLHDHGRGDDAERFVRGTFWRNFLVKYPESNRLHKQALRLSGEVAAARLPPAAARAARNHVWQSQCNCGYWHGVFGGLYLPHLRFALYRHLIAAQKLIDAQGITSGKTGAASHTFVKTDWNFDGRDEHLLNTPAFLIGFTADGAVDQLWLKRTGINLADTLTRRREAYHGFVTSGPSGGTKLEDQIVAKEQGLEAYLIYDQQVRETFSERVLPASASFEDYRLQRAGSPLAFTFREPDLKMLKDSLKIRFKAHASLPGGGDVEMLKTYTVALNGKRICVDWRFQAVGTSAVPEFRVVAETLFCLLAGNAPDRYLLWDENGAERRDILASHGEMPAGARVRLADEWLGLRAAVKAAGTTAVWRDALETVSQSEGGYERVYQGTVVAPVWDVSLAAGEKTEFGLQVDFDEETGNAQ
jgi:hypothetical protein